MHAYDGWSEMCISHMSQRTRKTCNKTCSTSEGADLPAHPRRLISLRWSHVLSTASRLLQEEKTRTLAILGECIGWSESLLAQDIFLLEAPYISKAFPIIEFMDAEEYDYGLILPRGKICRANQRSGKCTYAPRKYAACPRSWCSMNNCSYVQTQVNMVNLMFECLFRLRDKCKSSVWNLYVSV